MAEEHAPPLFRTVARHTGGQFEGGAVHRARGTNEQVPGVDVEDAREQTGGFTGGHQNFAEEAGRRRKLRDTPGSKTVVVPGKGEMTIYEGKNSCEDERWVYITEVKPSPVQSI